MPADRTQQKAKCRVCDTCGRSFARPSDLRRHQKVHEEGEREYKCPHEGCKFSAHQKGNLKVHMNSQHLGVRLPCGRADCEATFRDPSSRSAHRKMFHCHVDGEADLASTSGPVPIPVHKRVIRHVEQNSPDKVEEILGQFSAFTVESLRVPTPSDLSAPSDPSPSSSNAVSDEPSAPSPSKPNSSHVSQLPPSNEHAPDVQINSGFVFQSKFLHQSAYNDAGSKPYTLSPATFESAYDGDTDEYCTHPASTSVSSYSSGWRQDNQREDSVPFIHASRIRRMGTRSYSPNDRCELKYKRP